MVKKKTKAATGLIQVETEALRDVLGACLVTTTGPLSLPVLSCALIEIDAEKEQVRITSTDLDHWVTAVIPATIQDVPSMRLALPASSLVDIAREADSDVIEWRPLDPTKVDVKAGRCRLRLQGMDPGSFPPEPPSTAKPHFRVDVETLGEMIDSVGFATAKVGLYPVLTGILIEAKKDSIRLTATDRHRLATISNNNLKVKGKASWIVPAPSLLMVKRLWDAETTVGVGVVDNWLTIWDKKRTRVLSSRLIGGDYPDYRLLLKIPKGGKYLVKKDALAACLRRVSIVGSAVTGAHGRVVHLTFAKGAVRVEGSSDDRGQGKEALRVKSSDEKTRDFWMGAQMLLDSLRVIKSDTVRLLVNHTERPVLVENTEEDERHVLIPRRAP